MVMANNAFFHMDFEFLIIELPKILEKTSFLITTYLHSIYWHVNNFEREYLPTLKFLQQTKFEDIQPNNNS